MFGMNAGKQCVAMFILDVVFMSEFLSYSVDTFLKTIDC